MLGKTDAAVLRISLVALAGILLLAYTEMSKHPAGPRSGPRFGGSLLRPCPANPADRADYGEADFNWRLTALDGRQVKFEEFRDQVVFVNVWATWCAPCIYEMPNIQRLHDTMASEGIALVVVSEESADEVRPFVEAEGYTFPVYVSAGALPAALDSRRIPATYIISRQGRVVFRHAGPAAWDSPACLSFLRALR